MCGERATAACSIAARVPVTRDRPCAPMPIPASRPVCLVPAGETIFLLGRMAATIASCAEPLTRRRGPPCRAVWHCHAICPAAATAPPLPPAKRCRRRRPRCVDRQRGDAPPPLPSSGGPPPSPSRRPRVPRSSRTCVPYPHMHTSRGDSHSLTSPAARRFSTGRLPDPRR